MFYLFRLITLIFVATVLTETIHKKTIIFYSWFKNDARVVLIWIFESNIASHSL